MESLLKVEDLTVCYSARNGSDVTAVQGITFEVAPGEALGVLGESGSGKTTLALAILGLLPRSASVQIGAISFQGTRLLSQSEDQWQKIRGARISIIYQEPGLALNPVLRVREQVAEVLRAHENLNSRQAREESKKLLAQVGLAPGNGIDQAYPHQLSGGQRQRVVIAQAVACRPALLVADEPTTSLDAPARLEIIALLHRLQQQLQLALIFITHNSALLSTMADRILVMYAGRVIEQGSACEILEAPLHPYTQGLMRCGMAIPPAEFRPQRLASIPGDSPNLSNLPAGCAFAPRCPDRMGVCATGRPAETWCGGLRRVSCYKYEQ